MLLKGAFRNLILKKKQTTLPLRGLSVGIFDGAAVAETTR